MGGLLSVFTGLDEGTVTFPVACLFNQNVSLKKMFVYSFGEHTLPSNYAITVSSEDA